MPKVPTQADREVGQRIVLLRKARGLTQTQLGNAVGVTFQQLQKYERGRNRVSASRLQAIADELGVPVGAFYVKPESLDPAGASPSDLGTDEAGEVLRLYASLTPEARREALLILHSLVRVAEAARSPGSDNSS